MWSRQGMPASQGRQTVATLPIEFTSMERFVGTADDYSIAPGQNPASWALRREQEVF